MVLQSLVKYYEILSEDDKADIPKQGYCKANVSYALVISTDGELVDVMPMKVPDSKGKKLVPQPMEVPEKRRNSSDIKSSFLCDTADYILGIAKNTTEKGKRNAQKAFEDCKVLHKKILSDIQCEEARAIINFFDNWLPNHAIKFSELSNLKDEKLVFKLDGKLSFVHDNILIRKSWTEYYLKNTDTISDSLCLVSGIKGNISRIHPKISGIGGTNPALVSFDKDSNAFCSYGKDGKQGENAPVSSYCCFAYGVALNYLISSGRNKVLLGFSKPNKKENSENDYSYKYLKAMQGTTTLLFWSEAKRKRETIEYITECLFKGEFNENCDSYEHFEAEVKELLQKIKYGKKVNYEQLTEWKCPFYILGLYPSQGRAVITLFLRSSFNEILKNMAQYYEDFSIESDENESLSITKLLAQTSNPKSNKEHCANLNIECSFMRSVLTGQPYPAALFNSVMLRIRAEKDINYCKAAIIKAYLLRSSSDNKYKEVLTVSLNTISDNRAYVLGRLFAALEQAQKNASTSSLNTTIKDKYFTAACANPAIAFPVLLRLSSHHIAKAGHGWRDDERIGEIMQLLDVENKPFPKSLSLEEQGVFVLGYYHQKNKIISEIKEAAEAKKIKKQEEE